jgi:hypothetical protein
VPDALPEPREIDVLGFDLSPRPPAEIAGNPIDVLGIPRPAAPLHRLASMACGSALARNLAPGGVALRKAAGSGETRERGSESPPLLHPTAVLAPETLETAAERIRVAEAYLACKRRHADLVTFVKAGDRP